MKFRSILTIAAAAALVFTACEEKEDLGEAKILVNPSEITFEADGEASQTVALTATRDWTIKEATLPEWVALDKKSGVASAKEQTISISVDGKNEGNDRSGEVTFTIGFSSATLTVVQKGTLGELKKGSGTKDDPFSVAGVIEYVNGLENNVNSSEQFYVKGKVSTVSQNYTQNAAQYGNARFNISDDGTTATEFICYNTYYLGNKKFTVGQPDIKQGDEVIVKGYVVKYVGSQNVPTPEFVSGKSFLYSLNGKAEDEVVVDPSTVKQISCAEFIKNADTETVYRLVGTVASAVNTQYCSFDLNDGTGTVTVWSVNNASEWKDVVKQGGTVTVRGKYQLYNSTHEVVDCTIEKFEAGTTDAPKGSGTLADPYNAAAANELAAKLTYTDKDNYQKSDEVYVKGKVSSIKNQFSASYGTANFYLSDAGEITGSQFYAYGVYYLGNTPWIEGFGEVKVGQEIVICGKLMNYSGSTPETVNKEAYIYSIDGKTVAESVFGVAATELKVSASATSATIKVTGNCEWKAEASTGASIDPASGKGATDITVSFAANTDTKNEKKYTVTLTTTADVATKSYTVTVTQAKSGSVAAESVTLSFPDENKANNEVSAYTATWEAKIGDHTWAITAFNNNKWNGWTYIRCGRKNNASVADITSDIFEYAIKSVKVTYDKYASVNSTKLIVASDKAFEKDVQEIAGSDEKIGEVVYTVPAPAAGRYYKLVIDNQSASANGSVQISKIVYSVD